MLRPHPPPVLRIQKKKARRKQGGGGARLAYMPALDGMRALAVLAVLLYHAGLSSIPGGFLGVEVFFVISGYLISALLLSEWHKTGSIDLKSFWLRRARRLLPALYVMVVVVLGYCVVFLPSEVASLRDDALAAFGYVTNWYLIFADESYFEAVGRPSLLKHLWSLAIEEQFYLLWPPLLALILGLGARRFRKRRVLSIALCGALISSALMAFLYDPEVDPSLIYYATYTRATGLLIGAALALLLTSPESSARPMFTALLPRPYPSAPSLRSYSSSRSSWTLVSLSFVRTWYRSAKSRTGALFRRMMRRWGWTWPMALDAVGLLGLLGLAWMILEVGEYDPFLYRGGIGGVGLATAALITACVKPHTKLGSRWFLANPLLRWIGLRSYGIYLWHWPIFMVSRAHLDVPLDEGALLVCLRLAATLVVAHLSYEYVETPVRRGALGRGWKALKDSLSGPTRSGWHYYLLRLRHLAAVVPLIGLSVLLGVAVVQAKPPAPPSYLSSTREIHTEVSGKQAEPTTPVGSASAEAPEVDAPKTPKPEKTTASETRPRAAAPKGPVSAVGDSVMLGSAAPLYRAVDNLRVMDAEVGLQASEAIDILRARRASGQLGDAVIVDIGNNGVFTAEEFDEMMRVLAGVRRVVVVNVRVPRTWEQPNNEVIAEGTRRYRRAVLVDWYGASKDHPEYFVDDGVHLQPQGQRLYAHLIAERLKSPS